MAQIELYAVTAKSPGTSSLSGLYSVWKQRRQLRRLDDRALADIGISRAEADHEARRPVWDAPDHWYR